MNRNFVFSALALGVGLAAISSVRAQGGGLGGGGFGGGGFQGGQQGPQGGFGGGGLGAGGPQGPAMGEYDRSVGALDRALGEYVNGNEIKNILTPGEFSEWKLNLKAGQVVFAEAKSEAFDPALEVVDNSEKVLKTNDDRYPGDQRPLLMWRCEADGPYAVRARCFRDKSGGQFFFRIRIYDSIDLIDKPVEREFNPQESFLVRMPMKAGQIKRIFSEMPNHENYGNVHLGRAISPIGLPDIELAAPLFGIMAHTICASVDGDYYVLCWQTSGRRAKARVGTEEIVAQKLVASNGVFTAKADTQKATLWTASVKKGDVLMMTVPELSLSARIAQTEQPDLSKYDMKVDEKNPFYPKAPDKDEPKGPALVWLPARARDPRVGVFKVMRDTNLWIGANGAASKKGEYTMTLRPAAKELGVTKEMEGMLRIGNTDYWAFDGKAGDVMTFRAGAAGFAQRLIVRDPDLRPIWETTAQPDQTQSDWNMIVQRPGTYLVAVSALGDGGGGEYTLARNVFNAREFGKGQPAKGNFSTGVAEVWRFTAKPNEPLLIRWTSPKWSYGISIRDEKGNETWLPQTRIDGVNRYGVLTVDEPKTFVIVLISKGEKEDYAIELMDLPGYAKK